MRRLLLIFLVFLATGFAASAQTPLPKAAFKVGFIGAFSGQAEDFGNAARSGFEMGREDSPAGRGLEWQVFYEDDRSTAPAAQSAFRKLNEIEKVDLIIATSTAETAAALATLAEVSGVLLIVWSGDAAISRNRPTVLRSWPGAELEGAKLAEEAIRRNYRKIGLISRQDGYFRAVKSAFLENIAGSRIIVNQTVPGGQADCNRLAAEFKQAGIFSAGLFLDAGEQANCAKSLKEAGLRVDFFGTSMLQSRSEIRSSGDSLLGAWFATAAVNAGFYEKYLKRTRTDSAVGVAAAHYDLARILSGLRRPPRKDSPWQDLVSVGEFSGALQRGRFISDLGDNYLKFDLQIMQSSEEGFEYF